MATTPSFMTTSPSEDFPQLAIPPSSNSHCDFQDVELTSPPYLPSRNPNLSSPADKELATNASTTPPGSRSTTPRLMDSQPPLFRTHVLMLSGSHVNGDSHSIGKTSFDGTQATSDSSRSGIHDGEVTERPRIVRSRTIRVNTPHQRLYHNDELSPLPYPPDDFSSWFDSSLGRLENNTLPHVSPFATSSPSKAKFHHDLQRPASIIYLKRLLPESISRRVSCLTDYPPFWLALYFTLNLTLTLYNKSVLVHFPFPYTLTALHALCGTIGTFVLLRLDRRIDSSRAGARTPTSLPPPMPNLNGPQLVVLFLFSILYTLNIVVSNASLRLVTIPVVRASAPFFTLIFAAVLLGKRCNKRKLLSLVPVVVGVGLATYGDYYFTAVGFFLTLLGTLLASLKTILTNVILVKPTPTGLPISLDAKNLGPGKTQLQSFFPPSFFSSLVALVANRVFPPTPSSSPTHLIKPLSIQPSISNFKCSFALPKLYLSPIHLLYLLSPLAFIQTTLLAHFTGELDRARWHLFDSATATATLSANASNGWIWLLLNGVLAFFLNVVSFNANRRVGPLGMSVAANVKQVLTVLCAVVIFDLTITPANGLGILLTLIGGALYANVEWQEKHEKKSRIRSS